MNCLIDNILNRNLKKGRKLEVIKRYIKLRYHINIDARAIEKRVQGLNLSYRLN
ncbi:hypothetical protein QQ008_18135 [Fulvivirgaceae bacterium BMA10]|uniref:Uncharacterized protein n=1 Tax=Splendidivirga corallicola TaxID=3051826 RepID=A0ABT8KTJ3_9BACT|nr:hypothetical protein [Fulvivirgaceae bacterium BMA10]